MSSFLVMYPLIWIAPRLQIGALFCLDPETSEGTKRVVARRIEVRNVFIGGEEKGWWREGWIRWEVVWMERYAGGFTETTVRRMRRLG